MSNLFALRFGSAIPGYRFIARETVAIQVLVFKATLDVVEKTKYPLGGEVVLRLIAMGKNTLDLIAQFTGLEVDFVAEIVADEVADGNLLIVSKEIELTPLGRTLLGSFTKEIVYRKENVSIGWDSIAGQVVEVPTKNLKDIQSGFSEILVLPPSQEFGVPEAVRLKSNHFQDVETALTSRQAVARVLSSKYSYDRYHTAEILIFRDLYDSDTQLRLVNNGEIDERYTRVLNDPKYREILPIIYERLSNEETAETPLQRLLDLVRDPSSANYSELLSLLPRLVSIDNPEDLAKFENALRQLQSPHGSELIQISVEEHPEILNQALVQTKNRLLLVSPWIKSTVVDGGFLEKLSKLLSSAVEVDFVYGFGEDAKSDATALKKLCALSESFSNFRFYRHPNSHAKVLLADDTVITTSFNWLSFKGDVGRVYRHEEGTRIQGKEFVDRVYTQWQNRVIKDCVPACNTILNA